MKLKMGASTVLRYPDLPKDELFNVSIRRIGLKKRRIKKS